MKEHTITLQEDEYKLVQTLREMKGNGKVKTHAIDELLQQIEVFLQQAGTKKSSQWLQIGDRSNLRASQPVKPEEGSPLASDIILEQRNHLVGS